MALDPSISLGVRPMELANPLVQYGQIAQIQNAQNQNSLAQYQLGAAQRAEAKDVARTNMLAQAGTDDTAIANALLKSGDLKGYSDFVKSRQDTQKAEGDLVGQRMDLSKRRLETVRTPDEYLAWHNTNHKDPVLRKYFDSLGVTAESANADIMQKLSQPGGFEQLLRASALGLEKSMENHFANQNLGGTERTIAMPKYSLPGAPSAAAVVPGSEAKKTATPGELMVDRRARERLEAETATGNWSPDSVEFAAQTYAQTGQMPPVGMGAKAMGVRDKILQRASEIARGINVPAAPGAEPVAPVDMATAAGNVTSAKQTKAAQAAAVRDFSAGMSARRVTANNTAINHLDTMEKLATDLGNSDLRVVNTAATAFAKATGAPAPVNFDAARQLVAAEVIKAVVANGGGVKEREEAANQFARANSPAQLKGVVNTYKELLAGQLDTLGQQYETGTGRKDFESKLTPATKKVFETVRGKTETPAAGPIKISSDADYNKLPSGAMFIAPDGSQRRKP